MEQVCIGRVCVCVCVCLIMVPWARILISEAASTVLALHSLTVASLPPSLLYPCLAPLPLSYLPSSNPYLPPASLPLFHLPSLLLLLPLSCLALQHSSPPPLPTYPCLSLSTFVSPSSNLVLPSLSLPLFCIVFIHHFRALLFLVCFTFNLCLYFTFSDPITS